MKAIHNDWGGVSPLKWVVKDLSYIKFESNSQPPLLKYLPKGVVKDLSYIKFESNSQHYSITGNTLTVVKDLSYIKFESNSQLEYERIKKEAGC